MEILNRQQDGISVVAMSGRLTLDEVDGLKHGFKKRLAAGDRLFVFEMSGVPYLDSAGVGEMVACAKRAYEKGGAIKLVAAPQSKTVQILTLTGLDRVFEVFGTERDALASFSV